MGTDEHISFREFKEILEQAQAQVIRDTRPKPKDVVIQFLSRFLAHMGVIFMGVRVAKFAWFWE